MRADLYIVSKGLAESRSRAKAYIEGGRLFVNGKNIKKCSYEITENDKVELRGEAMPFVSRGGFKLLCALESFKLDINGFVCVDIGASTGGFTDCLLQNGAKRVYAIDCGSGQLHKSLLSDERVKSIENFNARNLSFEVLGESCDLAVMDVSFISQTLIYDAVSSVLKSGGGFISLIKPQFEAGKSAVKSGGIVKDKRIHISVLKSVLTKAAEKGFSVHGLAKSPITGGDGNTEYLAYFKLSEEDSLLKSRSGTAAVSGADDVSETVSASGETSLSGTNSLSVTDEFLRRLVGV